MSRLRSERDGNDAAAVAQSPNDSNSEVDEEEVGPEDASDLDDEKSETEQELERLVFGDSAGFREGLRDFRIEDEDEEEAEPSSGLAGLDDADVGHMNRNGR